MPVVEFAPPDFAALIRLLDTCALPHADLSTASSSEFLAVGDALAPVGVAGLEPLGEHGLLRSLAVAPECRNQGLGRQLVSAIEVCARARQIRSLFLLTVDAAPYFERLGFTTVPRERAPQPVRDTRQFCELCPATSILMSKSL